MTAPDTLGRRGATSDAPPSAPLAFARHDHAACRASCMAAARRICAERGLRLTPVRARVLDLLLESHAALGAYAILERLRAEGRGAQPPVAYRALDFLVAGGLAHRIEKLNAFVACARPGERHDPAFMICRDCREVAELSAPAGAALDGAAARLGFDIENRVIEAEGLCADCRDHGGRA